MEFRTGLWSRGLTCQMRDTVQGLLPVVQLLSRDWLFATIWIVALPGSSVHGISQARILEWVAISFSRRSSPPRDWTRVSCLGRWILYHWAIWKALRYRIPGSKWTWKPVQTGEKRVLASGVNSGMCHFSHGATQPQLRCWQEPWSGQGWAKEEGVLTTIWHTEEARWKIKGGDKRFIPRIWIQRTPEKAEGKL